MSVPVFIIATDLRPDEAAWASVQAQAAALHESMARPLGFAPVVDVACLPTQRGNAPPEYQLGSIIDRRACQGATEIFVMPAALELNIWQRSAIGEDLIDARRRHPSVSIHHDSVDPTYPLLVDCFAGLALSSLQHTGVSPQQAGLLLVASGQGDPGTRADSYRLMRLLWEQTGAARAEVGFIRHTRPFLPEALERCQKDPFTWVLVPQCQWDGELCEYAQVMLSDYQRAHPEAAAWQLVEPPGDHPATLGWLEQRMRRLWQEKRVRQAIRTPSAKHQPASPKAEVWSGKAWVSPQAASFHSTAGCIARARGPEPLADILGRVLPQAERYLVKVTWHGYATGTYTGPGALDLLLSTLPGKAVILEGHTSGRNLGDLDINWDVKTQTHRTLIRQQEIDYLKRTGLTDVIVKHRAQYLNVTEAWWDGACAPIEEVQAALGGITLQNPELVGQPFCVVG